MDNIFIDTILDIEHSKKRLYNMIASDLNIEDPRWYDGEFPNPYCTNVYFDDGAWSVAFENMIDGSRLYFLDYDNIKSRDFACIDTPSFDNTYVGLKGESMSYFKNMQGEWLILNNKKEGYSNVTNKS